MKMIRSLLIITFCSAFSISQAQDRNFGLGLIIGEPTGISFKYYVSADRAIDGALAWRLWRGRALHIHADHLWHNRSLISVSSGSLPLYYGVGVRLQLWNDRYWYRGRYYDDDRSRADLGVRFPVGLAYEFEGAPLDVFLEIVPVLNLIPDTHVDFSGGIGLRYWF
jgi:hypothetical protein